MSIIGSEKAILGSIIGGIGALGSQVGASTQVTLKEALYSLATAALTYLTVWLTTNTTKSPSPPTVVSPETPLTPETPAS